MNTEPFKSTPRTTALPSVFERLLADAKSEPYTFEITTDALATTTLEADPMNGNVLEWAEAFKTFAVEKNSALLCANQVGRSYRICYLNLKHAGLLYNLSVQPYPVDGSGDPLPLCKKPLPTFHSKDEKILVPQFSEVEVTFQRPYSSERVTVRSDKPGDNVLWYAAEMILNGALEWVPWDYGTFRRTDPKPRPNALCECGSGRKRKTCCGR